VSQKPDAPTLPPAGTDEHFVDFRSTAGSCFGRFMIMLLTSRKNHHTLDCPNGQEPIQARVVRVPLRGHSQS
jgi:hypothetical protein